MRGHSPTSKRNVLAREREKEALRLRITGKSQGEIAAELGVSDVAVCKMLKRVLERTRQITDETADDLRTLELSRLDRWLDRLQAQVELGDVKAIEVAIKVSKRRAELLGLDAPKKIDATITTHEQWLERLK